MKDHATGKKKKERQFTIALVVIALILFFVAYGLRNPGQEELDLCVRKCAKIKRSGQLVPTIKNIPAESGRYVGPWECICE